MCVCARVRSYVCMCVCVHVGVSLCVSAHVRVLASVGVHLPVPSDSVDSDRNLLSCMTCSLRPRTRLA